MKTITFRDMTWPSDDFMKVDTPSDAFDGIELINCVCKEVTRKPIHIYKNTFIHGGKFGYLCFNRPNDMISFMADMMKVVIEGTVLNRIEAGLDVFLEVGSDIAGTKSYLDEIEICGRASLHNVVSDQIEIERHGIARIHTTVKVDHIIVYGTAIIGTEQVGRIVLKPGGKVRFCLHDETHYKIECEKDRVPFKATDNYICG